MDLGDAFKFLVLLFLVEYKWSVQYSVSENVTLEQSSRNTETFKNFMKDTETPTSSEM